MSGIVGIVYLDDQRVDSEDIQRMLNAIAHRGSDGVGSWIDAQVGLGHRLLLTLPEDAGERFPLRVNEDKLIITGDLRLDNRETLIAELHLNDQDPAHLSDSLIVLRAYQQWGSKSAEHLLGDFAFALWDAEQAILYCARDQVGCKPFYYYQSGTVFAFASEIKALLALPFIPKQINEQRVAEYLLGSVSSKTETAYQNIFRLPAASSLRVVHRSVQLQEYWAFQNDTLDDSKTDEEYVEQFREIFLSAIQCRLRSMGRIGSMLSGGLDSSAVTGGARQILQARGGDPIEALIATFPQTPETDESAYARLVAQMPGIDPHYIPVDGLSPLYQWSTISRTFEEPMPVPNMYLTWRLFEVAQENQVKVMFDGQDGDTTVSHGLNYFSELAQANRWSDFAREADLLTEHQAFYGYNSRTWIFQDYGVPRLKQWVEDHQWLSLLQAQPTLTKEFRMQRKRYLRAYVLKSLAPVSLQTWWLKRRTLDSTVLAADFAARLPHGVQETNPVNRALMTEQAGHLATINSPLRVNAIEMLDLVASRFSMELRHPFFDKRLIEFSLKMPIRQKIQGGWTRFILRKSLENMLPAEVQWRGGKSHLGWAFWRNLYSQETPRLESIIPPEAQIWNYVNRKEYLEAYNRFTSVQNEQTVMPVWQILSVALWLESLSA